MFASLPPPVLRVSGVSPIPRAAANARRSPGAAAFAAPYAFNLRSRCRAAGVPFSAAPYFVAYDVVQLAATVRGAVRHRTFIL